jgi:hypothetical protein
MTHMSGTIDTLNYQYDAMSRSDVCAIYLLSASVSGDAAGEEEEKTVRKTTRIVLPAISLIILFHAAGAVPDVTGTWQGAFNSMPTVLGTNGSYPERINRFTLWLRKGDHGLVGEFEPIGPGIAPAQKFEAVRGADDRYCFDLRTADGEDLRWCIRVGGNTLTGLWDRGPEGGPAQGGLGTGARLFKIEAKRVRPTPK